MISETCDLCHGFRPLGGVCPDCGYDPDCMCCILAVDRKSVGEGKGENVGCGGGLQNK